VFGLRERTSTALELAHAPRFPRHAPELVQQQLEDALAAARQVKPRTRLPLRFRRVEILAAFLLVAGVTLIWAWGGPYFQAAFQQRAVQGAIRQQAAQIEALRSQIEADPALSPEQREALTRPLQEALEKLRSAESMEQAVSALHGAEEQLRELSSTGALEQARGLQKAGNGLSRQEGSPLQSFGESLAGGDFLEAAQEIQSLDPAGMSAEEAAALADQLEEIAGALEATDVELAQQLRAAAAAIREGDAAAAQQALQRASRALAEAGQQIHQAQVAGQAAAQAAQGQQRVIQAGRSAQGGQAGNQPGSQAGQQPGNQPGGQASAGQGQGQGAGQGSSQGSGSQPGGNSGGGAGRGEGGGDSGPGPEAGDDPIQQDNGPGDGGERAYEPIYAPQHLGGSGGAEVAVPGSGQPGDQVLGQGNTAPGSPGDSSVPYVEVLPFYEEAYRQAIESGNVPVFLRDIVRAYFSSLQP
jgi:hypothetical protein